MLKVIMQLLENNEYEKSLKLAEQQLLRGGWNMSQLAQLNLVICRCRLGLQDIYGAVPSGMLAVKLARDAGDFDTLGRALLNVGTALVGIRQYDQALHQLYSFFENSFQYTGSRRLEGAVWKHIGIAHQRKQESEKALQAFERARAWFDKQNVDHAAFTVTSDMVNTYLQMHDVKASASLDAVPDLIQFERDIARKYPHDSYYKAMYLLDKAAWYMHSRRYGRAMVSAMQALETRRNDYWVSFHSHMLLHRCTKILGNPKQALGYAVAARVAALQGRHHDLEFVASQAMADVIRQQGVEVVRELDQEYQAIGIDLGQYFSPALLGRPN